MSWAITLALALIIVGIAGEVYTYFRSRYTKRIIEDCLKRRDCSRYLR